MPLLQHAGKVQQVAEVHFLQPAFVAESLGRCRLNRFRRKRLAQLQGVSCCSPP